MSIDQPEPARSFGGVAEAYDRGRPTYPREAAVWLTSDQPLTVLELGAGTGKLTEQLVALGHDVHATEPDPQMLALLEKHLPDVRVSQAPAEEIPAGDASYDVVVQRAGLPLVRPRPGAARRSPECSSHAAGSPWSGTSATSGSRGSSGWARSSAPRTSSGTRPSSWWSRSCSATSRTRRSSSGRSSTATRSATWSGPAPTSPSSSPAEQEAKLAEVLAFYDDFGRGMDGMQLPYAARCFRAQVLDRVTPTLTDKRSADGDEGIVSDGSSTDMLLIDFH